MTDTMEVENFAKQLLSKDSPAEPDQVNASFDVIISSKQKDSRRGSRAIKSKRRRSSLIGDII